MTYIDGIKDRKTQHKNAADCFYGSEGSIHVNNKFKDLWKLKMIDVALIVLLNVRAKARRGYPLNQRFSGTRTEETKRIASYGDFSPLLRA